MTRSLLRCQRGVTSVQMLVLTVGISLGCIVAVRQLGGAVSTRSRCAGDQIVALGGGAAPCTGDAEGGPGNQQPPQQNADDDNGGDDGGNDEEFNVGKELLDLVADLVGFTDAKKCITEGDIGACVFTLLNFSPFKLLTAGVKILKNLKRIGKLVDRLLAARKARKAKKEADAARCASGKCDKPNTCFAPGTLVMAAGGMTPIEDLRAGDQVWSRDDETGEEGYRSIAQTYVTPEQRLLAVSLEDAAGEVETLEVTAPHPFQVEGRGWVAAGELEVGDRIVSAGGGTLGVVGAEATGRSTTVYNFEVEGFHTYFVGRGAAWVHNDCKDKKKDEQKGKKDKKTNEKCKGDGDCARGHCHTKRDGEQVCVDCSAKEIGDFLGIKDRFCKNEPRSCSGLSLDDDFSEFTSRIANGGRCIGARDAENKRCFNGGDPGHGTAVKEAEKARTNCQKKLDDKTARDGAPPS